MVIGSGRKLGVLVSVFGFVLILTMGCQSLASQASPTNPPPAVDVPVRAKLVWDGSYVRDIQPILDQYCVQCHGPGDPANGLRLDTYEGVMKGTQFGPVVIPGSPASSTLVAVIQGTAAPQIRMPHQARQLTPNRIENIILWIEAGAKKD